MWLEGSILYIEWSWKAFFENRDQEAKARRSFYLISLQMQKDTAFLLKHSVKTDEWISSDVFYPFPKKKAEISNSGSR